VAQTAREYTLHFVVSLIVAILSLLSVTTSDFMCLPLERFEKKLKNAGLVDLQRHLELHHNYKVRGHCTKCLQIINSVLKALNYSERIHYTSKSKG